MVIPERLRFYLVTLMKKTSFTHYKLDELALHFLLEKVDGPVGYRCEEYVNSVSGEDFPKMTEYVLNTGSGSIHQEGFDEVRDDFIRALKVNGFEVKATSGSYRVEPKFAPERLQETRQEVETLLTDLGFGAVQGSLNVAENLYIKGEYAKSLWNSRKAIEDLMILLARKMGADQKDFLTTYVKSERARDLIKKIDWYTCKGHETELPDREAVFGYHLVISAIYHLLLLFDR